MASDVASGRDGNHVPTRGMTNKEANAVASLPDTMCGWDGYPIPTRASSLPA